MIPVKMCIALISFAMFLSSLAASGMAKQNNSSLFAKSGPFMMKS